MGNTAFFEDATMIDHLRMSITTDDSMTPSPFLKIFIGLMSATDSTATFKTYASNKDALILHGTPMGPPLYESTPTTTTTAANAVVSSGINYYIH